MLNTWGVKCHFLHIRVKSAKENGWIVQEIKCIFS
jgi:hypothetical protein